MRALIVATAAWLCAGCPSLVKPHNPPKIRYFTVETPPAEQRPGPAQGLEVRLARVDAASHIEDRIAFRDDGAEVGYYGSLRWADPPEHYLRRAISRALFEDRQLREIVSGVGPSLEIELHAFEELRAPRHAARIALTWRLRDGRTVLVQKTLTVERPIAGGADPVTEGADAIAGAMAAALREVVDEVVAEVVVELARERPDGADAAEAAATAP